MSFVPSQILPGRNDIYREIKLAILFASPTASCKGSIFMLSSVNVCCINKKKEVWFADLDKPSIL